MDLTCILSTIFNFTAIFYVYSEYFRRIDGGKFTTNIWDNETPPPPQKKTFHFP